ncbi:MAG TPA: hypothetical protein EYQ00_02755 [Dehalococcoidia bacterium]|nr:hypothetical protein [Dehalococcoidia bacterium]
MQPRTKTKGTKVEGDQFVLCTWPISLRGQPYVIGSSNSINKLCEGIPDALQIEESRVSVCSVKYWIVGDYDPTDAVPYGVETIFEVEPYDLDLMED